ncbi:hypothetical protein CEXT_332751 [Caerostris extrusa]|uniref:Uncharacterized protein n=1 Tax=Caerostris extrusa TaxID=172846 RepID=A0AAV4RYW3_CAEEX|nr:hypothetical protein CEXT_332751 [Caerostris extrusa]
MTSTKISFKEPKPQRRIFSNRAHYTPNKPYPYPPRGLNDLNTEVPDKKQAPDSKTSGTDDILVIVFIRTKASEKESSQIGLIIPPPTNYSPPPLLEA